MAISTIGQNGLGSVYQNNGPTFRAVTNTTQSNLSANTATKLTVYGTVQWDTSSAFTSNKFQPLVAGYYQIEGGIQFGVLTGAVATLLYIYKNGSNFTRTYSNSPFSYQPLNVSGLVYLNGSTDYVEIYAEVDASSGTFATYNDSSFGYFSGCLVRAA